MKTIALFLIRGYQLLLSPLIGNQCRFEPSCSHYTAQAIELYGVIKGIKLGFTRIIRCRPGAKWGYDPVPTCHKH